MVRNTQPPASSRLRPRGVSRSVRVPLRPDLEAEPDRARVHVHRGGHAIVDPPDEVTRVSLGFDHRERCNRIRLELVEDVMHGALLGSHGWAAAPLVGRQQGMVMDSLMRQGHQDKGDFPPPWGCGM